MLGSQRGWRRPTVNALMDDLCAFARHVSDDLTQREQASRPPAHSPSDTGTHPATECTSAAHRCSVGNASEVFSCFGIESVRPNREAPA